MKQTLDVALLIKTLVQRRDIAKAALHKAVKEGDGECITIWDIRYTQLDEIIKLTAALLKTEDK